MIARVCLGVSYALVLVGGLSSLTSAHAAPPTKTSEKEKLRTWTDSTGNHTVEAKFVEFKDGKVSLEKEDGTAIAVPVEKLSEADQRFVRIRAKAEPTAQPSTDSQAKAVPKTEPQPKNAKNKHPRGTKAVAKNPENRQQSMADLFANLEAVTKSPTASEAKTAKGNQPASGAKKLVSWSEALEAVTGEKTDPLTILLFSISSKQSDPKTSEKSVARIKQLSKSIVDEWQQAITKCTRESIDKRSTALLLIELHPLFKEEKFQAEASQEALRRLGLLPLESVTRYADVQDQVKDVAAISIRQNVGALARGSQAAVTGTAATKASGASAASLGKEVAKTSLEKHVAAALLVFEESLFANGALKQDAFEEFIKMAARRAKE